jgi:hypothetical protein
MFLCKTWDNSSIPNASLSVNQEVLAKPFASWKSTTISMSSFVGARKHSVPYLLIFELQNTFDLGV